MTRLDDVFTVHTARSVAYEVHEQGPIPFISNGLSNNGVVGLVSPEPRDRVFHFSSVGSVCF